MKKFAADVGFQGIIDVTRLANLTSLDLRELYNDSTIKVKKTQELVNAYKDAVAETFT